MAPTRRRDDDPVKLTGNEQSGFRIQYWTSGIPGIGRRVLERAGRDRARAEERERHIRSSVALGGGVIPKYETFSAVAAMWIDEVIRPGRSAGTLKAYRRDINLALRHIRAVPVEELTARHYALVLDEAAKTLGKNSVQGIARTLSSLRSWAVARHHFPKAAFGDEAERREIRRQVMLRYKSNDRISISDCPTWDDVISYADALQEGYERGHSLIVVLATTGLRLSEALGLQVDDIDLDTMTVRVERQANRLAPWPATCPPKGGKSRTAYVWAKGRPALEQAVAAANDDGWLFPPDVEQFGTRGLWWTNRLTDRMTIAREASGWRPRGWGTHWTRHHWATYSLAPRPAGYGIPLATVSQGLGHSSPSVTLDKYTHATENAATLVQQLTAE